MIFPKRWLLPDLSSWPLVYEGQHTAEKLAPIWSLAMCVTYLFLQLRLTLNVRIKQFWSDSSLGKPTNSSRRRSRRGCDLRLTLKLDAPHLLHLGKVRFARFLSGSHFKEAALPAHCGAETIWTQYTGLKAGKAPPYTLRILAGGGRFTNPPPARRRGLPPPPLLPSLPALRRMGAGFRFHSGNVDGCDPTTAKLW